MEREYRKRLVVKPVLYGLLGSFVLLFLYFLILILLSSLSNTIQQFISIWYWIIILSIGFGIQIALFTYVHGFVKIKSIENSMKGTVVATGSISTASMVACCLHRVTDVLPFIGLVGVSIFLIKYQTFFLLLGVLSNLIGITIMLKTIQKHNLYRKEKGIIRKLMRFNMGKLFYFVFIGSIIILLIKLILGG